MQLSERMEYEASEVYYHLSVFHFSVLAFIQFNTTLPNYPLLSINRLVIRTFRFYSEFILLIAHLLKFGQDIPPMIKLSKPEQINRLTVLGLLLVIISSGCASSHNTESNQELIAAMEKSLRQELLNAWYPACLDTVYGGFLSDFTYDWHPEGSGQNKMIVTQSRQVWTASQAAMFFNEDKYRGIAAHGLYFLSNKMWDETYGGFYWRRSRAGEPLSGAFEDGKTAYGNAFAIYALVSYFAMSGDSSALRLAQQTFWWLDKHHHDPEFRGYFDRLARDGSWLSQSNSNLNGRELARANWKDQNSSIHLLEAFTALFSIWPDSLLRRRLFEMLVLIRDTIATARGCLTLYLERDWTPVSFRDSSETVRKANYFFDHVSFGHDVETAYLMLEASHVLELESDTTTLIAAKRMVDHALAKGWDDDKGGFYYEGYYFGHSDSITIINAAKTWWAQAEGLNVLLLMAKLFPHEKKYEEAFHKQWQYMNAYLIDHEHGGWYKEGLDNSPDQWQSAKGSEWKVNYHESRALMNCIKMLRSDHELIKHTQGTK